MSDSIFSGIDVDMVNIVSSTIWVDPDEHEGCNASLEVNTEAVHSSLEDGMWSLPMRMNVDVIVSDDNGVDTAHFHLVLDTTVSGGDFDGCTQEHADEILGIHAVNHLYLFARSHIEYVTAMTAIGRFTIPDINPKRVLEE